MRYFLFLAWSLVPLSAEVIDRIAIIAGGQVISELQIDEELRVTAFLNGAPMTRDASTRRAAASHLIEQLLVKREMELSRYPLPDPADVDKYVKQVRAALSNSKDFEAMLRSYRLTDDMLREHLQLQLTTLRFIEFRFRPDLGTSEHRTDEVLDAWLEENRKQAHIVYLDKSLE
jgi:hypothetical protein